MRIYTSDCGDSKSNAEDIYDAVRFAAGDFGLCENDSSQIADWSLAWLRRLESERAPPIAPD